MSGVVNQAPVPMRAQQTASDPALSVWVSANAGTGKTKVLTDRVLRLLLGGTAPSRILCLTYTKAAAAEMQNRIHSTLAQWVALDDAGLADVLRRLTDRVASQETVKRARSLFATVLDAPEGVRIQTIHSFCQSLLRRFPLEAGVQPHFEVIDERTAIELLSEARMRLFARSLDPKPEEQGLADAVQLLSGRLAEGQFHELLSQLVGERRNLLPALSRANGISLLLADVFAALGVSSDDTEEGIFKAVFAYDASEELKLREAIKQLLRGSKTDIEIAQKMCGWWECADVMKRRQHWEQYRAAWMTGTGGARKKLATKAVTDTFPQVVEVLQAEQARCLRYEERLSALANARYTEAAIALVEAMMRLYDYMKKTHQSLDYDDLILLSLRLLQRQNIAPWVLYKLDGGLDHLLIDEAQDTSPEQWALVKALIGDFFSGETTREGRSLFVVGDEKQSIYSFQGAAPKAFGAERRYFSGQADAAQLTFEELSLSVSFRSTAAVLQAVDAVISQPHVQRGLSFEGGIVPHEAHRAGSAGLVELWPVMVGDDREQRDIWDVKKELVNERDARFILADRIANEVAGWLRDGALLESQNRPIRAGDVLVLVRSRNAFMHHLVRALKRLGVPVAGVDRMVLTENIAVMDLLALAEFLLLPEDDLSLACVLKSPLCGVSEEALFELAYGRKGSLWQEVQAKAPEAAAFLGGLLEAVDYIRPYELFANVLEEQGKRLDFARRMGDEVFDPLDEFLALALDYERSHAPSLQGFLHWVRSGETTIKRDMEQGMDAVRIMTVHGSKGLQAPIVFLPDTTDVPRSRNQPLWTLHEGRRVMLWSPSSAEDAPAVATLREAHKQEQAEEYRRLLYVAMTRAEDRLYVAGWLGRNRKEVPQESWYRWIADGLHGVAAPVARNFGDEEVTVQRLASAQTAAVQQKSRRQAREALPPMPAHLRTMPAAEPYPPQPLVPSRSDAEVVQASTHTEGAVLSPVAEGERFKRGNLMHRLLQWLPDTPAPAREEAARCYLARYGGEVAEAEQNKLLAEVLDVLAHPDMAPVFAQGSLAEVPLTGLVEMGQGEAPRILSGQVDRLCVQADGVWVIDYKTQRVPPATAQEVPTAYLRQMAVYRAALMAVYPDRPVHCALLWTAGPKLMPLPSDLLAAALDSPHSEGLISGSVPNKRETEE